MSGGSCGLEAGIVQELCTSYEKGWCHKCALWGLVGCKLTTPRWWASLCWLPGSLDACDLPPSMPVSARDSRAT